MKRIGIAIVALGVVVAIVSPPSGKRGMKQESRKSAREKKYGDGNL